MSKLSTIHSPSKRIKLQPSPKSIIVKSEPINSSSLLDYPAHTTSNTLNKLSAILHLIGAHLRSLPRLNPYHRNQFSGCLNTLRGLITQASDLLNDNISPGAADIGHSKGSTTSQVQVTLIISITPYPTITTSTLKHLHSSL